MHLTITPSFPLQGGGKGNILSPRVGEVVSERTCRTLVERIWLVYSVHVHFSLSLRLQVGGLYYSGKHYDL
jgi:hypothetical protein